MKIKRESVHAQNIRRIQRRLEEQRIAATFQQFLQKVSTGGGQFVTGEETEHVAPVEHKEQRAIGNELVRERRAEYLDSAEQLRGVKLAQSKSLDLVVLAKGKDTPFVIAGYASPVVVDQEGHRISHRALRADLERYMALDQQFANINLMHSNLTIGRAIPEFTTAKGEKYTTHVDDVGLFVVAEVRTDQWAPKAIMKVIDDIEQGKLRSFSISGHGSNPVFMCDEQRCFYSIDEVEFWEITVCLPPDEEVLTKQGWKRIADVTPGVDVVTHLNRWQAVTDVFKREVKEDLVVLETEVGKTKLTKNHPVRTLKYGGRHKGTHYEWVEAGKLLPGDVVQYHVPKGACRICGSVLLKKNKVFCSDICRYLIPNRAGKTIASGDEGAIRQANKLRGVTKMQNPRLSGGIKSIAGKAKHLMSVTSKSFREKCSIRAKKQWQNSEYVKKIMWYSGPNKLEQEFAKATGLRFVGTGDVIIGGKIPDFEVDSGKVVELFGDYWHQGDDPQVRINYFRQYGVDCLVIWESEFRQQRAEVLERVKEFSGNRWSAVVSVEMESYEGVVHNLEVANDQSYVTRAGTVHNCAEGVNQDAQFNVISKAV